MNEIRDMWGEPAGKDLFFVASMTDYYYLETLSSTAITHVYQDGIKLKVLGRNIRTFKPGVPFNIQVSVDSSDVLSLLWRCYFGNENGSRNSQLSFTLHNPKSLRLETLD